MFDGHDGELATKFVKKHLHGWVFGKESWLNASKSDNPTEIETTLVNIFNDIEENFFKSIDPLIFEKQALQSRIPLVSIRLKQKT